MRAFLVLMGVLAASGANAECLQWGRSLNTGERVCITDDAVNHNPVIPECSSVTGCGNVTITNTPAPKCPDGWTLVSDLAMGPMCARELKKPE